MMMMMMMMCAFAGVVGFDEDGTVADGVDVVDVLVCRCC